MKLTRRVVPVSRARQGHPIISAVSCYIATRRFNLTLFCGLACAAAGLLTRDARKVERKKAGRPKARKSNQWGKR